MTIPKTGIAEEGTTGGALPRSDPETAQASIEKTSISDERRMQDALEDDEVGEALRDLHKAQNAAN